MPFEITFPTRHTDTFASTGLVHAGVLLALTEMAYAEFEKHCGVSKPEDVFAVQRSTEATYRSPLRWEEGARILVSTLAADRRGFEQEFEVRSAANDRLVATIRHRWAWLDTARGERVDLTEAVQEKLLAGE